MEPDKFEWDVKFGGWAGKHLPKSLVNMINDGRPRSVSEMQAWMKRDEVLSAAARFVGFHTNTRSGTRYEPAMCAAGSLIHIIPSVDLRYIPMPSRSFPEKTYSAGHPYFQIEITYRSPKKSDEKKKARNAR